MSIFGDDYFATLEFAVESGIFWLARVEGGQTTPEFGLNQWYTEMTDAGIINSGGSSGGGGVSTDPISHEQMINIIAGITGDIADNLFHQLQGVMFENNRVNTNIINNQFNVMRSEISSQLAQQNSISNQNKVELLNAINEIQVTGGNVGANLLEPIQELFLVQDNRIAQRLENTFDQYTNVLNSGLSEIDNSIDYLGLRIDTIDSGNSGGSSAWSEGYIIDLLGILENIRVEIMNKVFNVDVTLDGTNNNGGSGSNGDTTNNDANIGNLLGNLGLLLDVLNGDTSFFDGQNSDTNQTVAELIRQWGSGEFSNLDELEQSFFNAGIGGHLFHFFWNITSSLALLFSVGMSSSRPYLNNIETLARTDALDGLVPLQNLIELFVRKDEDFGNLFTRFRKLGYRDEDIGIMIKAYQIQLQEPFLREALHRKEIDISEWRLGMEKLGYKQSDLSIIENVIFNLPSVQDAILFAVREAYDDTQAEFLELDSDYDLIKDQFETILQGNGVKPEFGKYYWRSHWQLPSPTQLYEMLWRGLIDINELDNALKANDYSPKWRSNLRDIAYKTYTRVDIRRLHRLGLMTDAEVFEANKENGYNDDKSQKLTDYVLSVNGNSGNEALLGLSVSNTLKSYNNGLVSFDETIDSLVRSGLTNIEANIILENSKIAYSSDILGDVTKDNRARIIRELSSGFIDGVLPESYIRDEFSKVGYPLDSVEQEVNYLKTERDIKTRQEHNDITLNRYLKYEIGDNDVLVQLANRGYNGNELQDILNLWKNVREDRKQLPTKTEAGKFFQGGMIDVNEYKDILRGRGTPEKYLDMYVSLVS